MIPLKKLSQKIFPNNYHYLNDFFVMYDDYYDFVLKYLKNGYYWNYD